MDLVEKIKKISAEIGRNINIMELCGTHTQTIARYGIKNILPNNIHLIAGPGCPVCVTDQSDIDKIVAIARAGVPIASYGDALRVPGQFGSLDDARREGFKVFDVYSVDEALVLQKENKNLVFFGLGFETTAPATAYAIKRGLKMYSTHKSFLPAMHTLLEMKEINIDGFINPGHVSVIIGSKAYQNIKQPQVIAGFSAKQVLEAIYFLLKQIKEGRAEVENNYLEVVGENGNKKALDLLAEVFELKNASWRGFGVIINSGMELRKNFAEQDAKIIYQDILDKVPSKFENKACRCSEIIRGLATPNDCPMFGKLCTPEKPYGPCMVSVEGACSIAYNN